MVSEDNNYYYNHEDWEIRRNILRFLIKNIGVALLAKLDNVEGLENVPTNGPGILLINHIAFIDSLIATVLDRGWAKTFYIKRASASGENP